MVALRWCEEDEAGKQLEQPELLGRLPVPGGSPPVRGQRRLQLAPPDAQRPGARPAPVVRRAPKTFLWRRAIALSLVAGLGATVWLATGRLASVAGAQVSQDQRCLSGGAPGEGQAAGSCGQLYVAKPGDTIWSIAVAYSRGGDPRPLVDKLESEIGGGALQPGERLSVP
jgi:hypothetical protein